MKLLTFTVSAPIPPKMEHCLLVLNREAASYKKMKITHSFSVVCNFIINTCYILNKYLILKGKIFIWQNYFPVYLISQGPPISRGGCYGWPLIFSFFADYPMLTRQKISNFKNIKKKVLLLGLTREALHLFLEVSPASRECVKKTQLYRPGDMSHRPPLPVRYKNSLFTCAGLKEFLIKRKKIFFILCPFKELGGGGQMICPL